MFLECQLNESEVYVPLKQHAEFERVTNGAKTKIAPRIYAQ
jgi:hypothetical protein